MKKFLTILLIALMAGAMVFAAPTFTGNAKINLGYNTVQNAHSWDAYLGGQDGLSLGFDDELWSISLNSGTMAATSDAGLKATLKIGALIAKSIGYETKSTIDVNFGWGTQKASMYYTGHSADSSIYGDLQRAQAATGLTDYVTFTKLTLANPIKDSDTGVEYAWSSGFTGKATIGYGGFKIIGAVAVNEVSADRDITTDRKSNRRSFGFAVEGANLVEFINFSAGVNITNTLNINDTSYDTGSSVYIWKVNANFDLGKALSLGFGLKLDGYGQFIGADADKREVFNSDANMYAGQLTGTFGAFSAYVEYTNEADLIGSVANNRRFGNLNVGAGYKFNSIFSLDANLCIPAMGYANWKSECELGFDAGITASYGSFTAYAGATKGVWKDWNNEVGFKSWLKFVF